MPAALAVGMSLPAEGSFRVYRVAAEYVDSVWEQVEPLLRKGAKREAGRFTTRDIYQWFKTREQELWVVTRNGRYVAAGMVRFYKHPTGKQCSCWHLLGGSSVRDWAAAAFESWSQACRLQGVTEMSIVGRKGWLRYVAPFGFKLSGVILVREEV